MGIANTLSKEMVLEADGLTIEYETREKVLRAAEDVSLSLDAQQTHGLVGESGSGKSTVAKAILGLLPDNGRIVDGEINYRGEDLTAMSAEELRTEIRWKKIAWISQNAMNALDPVWKIGSLMVEVMREHEDISKPEARDRAQELLEQVGLEKGVMNDYGHELSGGQRQRVSIALALTNDPEIVIADEPTTGLDVMIQEGIVKLLNRLKKERGMSVLIISHDMAAISEISDRVSVMYGGQIVEQGQAADIFNRPSHPYTIGLQNAFPTIDHAENLVTIPGTPPDLSNLPSGCRFKDRCPFAEDNCGETVPYESVGNDRTVRCQFTDQAERFREEGKHPETWQDQETILTKSRE